MARIKLKQILSNLKYDASNEQLILQGDYNPSFVVSGSILVKDSQYVSGSITINGVDTFGDSGSFDSVDLGEYWYLYEIRTT